jgi:hypothetical protein
MIFPVLAIKGLNGQLLGLGVQATDVHINAIGVRPGGIKGFDTTVTAKGMLGNSRAKSVSGETICAAEEFEVRQRQNQVQVACGHRWNNYSQRRPFQQVPLPQTAPARSGNFRCIAYLRTLVTGKAGLSSVTAPDASGTATGLPCHRPQPNGPTVPSRTGCRFRPGGGNAGKVLSLTGTLCKLT